MYLGGEGGTGKSRVIEALIYVSKAWENPGAVKVCAPTGIAASIIGGQTFHSLVKLQKGKYSRSKHRMQRASEEEIAEFADVVLLIVDEVSMLARRHLAILDLLLRRVKEQPEKPFGGVMVLLCGDFFQIPPVGEEPVYVDPASSKNRCYDDVLGYDIWKAVKHVILLKENVRQCRDEKYAKCLQRARYGKMTEEDLVFLNERVMTPKVVEELESWTASHIPIVVRGNEMRNKLNWKCINRRAKMLGVRPILCVADMKNGINRGFCQADLDVLLNTYDTKTSNLATILPLLPGMPVRISQNVALEIGAANGTEGILVGVRFDDNTTFETCVWQNIACYVASKLPIASFVHSAAFARLLPRRLQTLPKHMPHGTVPLTPHRVPKFSIDLRGRKLRNGNKMTITQLPFVPSYAFTTFKVQGRTAPSIIAYPFLKGRGGKTPRAALYVVLSRIRTRDGLFLTERLNSEHLRYFQPSEELLQEDIRLHSFHDRTVNNHESMNTIDVDRI